MGLPWEHSGSGMEFLFKRSWKADFYVKSLPCKRTSAESRLFKYFAGQNHVPVGLSGQVGL